MATRKDYLTTGGPTTLAVKISSGLEWKQHVDHLCSTSIPEFQPDGTDDSVDIDIPTPQPEDGINKNEQQECNEQQEETTQPSRDQGENERSRNKVSSTISETSRQNYVTV